MSSEFTPECTTVRQLLVFPGRTSLAKPPRTPRVPASRLCVFARDAFFGCGHGPRREICGLAAGILLLACLGAFQAQAGILWLAERRILMVTDFPEAAPCTPERLWAVDRAHGWGIVTRDSSNDAYTVDADLWIGNNDGTETYFNLGSRNHPREVLQVRGNVVVYPDWVAGVNEGEQWWYAKRRCVNRLTVGASNEPGIAATLSLDSATTNAHGIYVGMVPAAVGRPAIQGEGGQLHVFHGTLTALAPDAAHALSGCTLLGNSLILHQATLSWIGGHMSYGLGPRWLHPCSVEETVFEHGGVATYGGKLAMNGCILRDVQTAVQDCGDLEAVFTDCVFSNNACNWQLSYSGQGLTCIDCAWTPPRHADEYRAWDNPQTKKRQYPAFISRRHVIVSVADGSGKPISNAVVDAGAEQPGTDLTEHARVGTDAAGKTPGPGQANAILLTEVIKQATDALDQPAVREFSYQIKVTASGFQPAVKTNLMPTLRWQTIPVIMNP